MEGKIRAAIYARVSTADGRPDTKNQLGELRRFSETMEWEIAGEYIDYESGSRADPAEFKRLFADAAQRRFDLVLVWALDRLSREGVAKTFQHIKRLTANGIEFVSFTEEHFRTTGPAGELMIAVAAWIARQERVRISERVRAGLGRARINGTRSGKAAGRPRVIFNRETVVEGRRQGKSWRQIARECHAGVTTVRRAYRDHR